MWPTEFRHLYAEYAHCAPEEFEKRVFWRTMYLHAIPIAWLIRLIYPPYFRLDLETIDRVAQTYDAREYAHDLDRFRFLSSQAHSLMRSMLLIRISGRKLVRLRRAVEKKLKVRAQAGTLELQPAR